MEEFEMNKRKKVALYAASSLLATSLVVGGASFALFKSSATNGPNLGTAGTVEITAKRNDVPNNGPMFYTESVAGAVGGMPTGLWAPGDAHTRGLFLKNEGTLEAKLATITATAADSNGNPITAGAQYDDNMLFAQQAKVKIWEIQEVDPLIGMRVSPQEMDMLMGFINEAYEMWLAANPTADLSQQNMVSSLLTAVNAYLYEELSQRNDTFENDQFKVVKMHDRKLNRLAGQPYDASSFNIKLAPGEVSLLGFTVEMEKNPQNVDKNSMQGKTVYFNFGTDWVQTRNN
jgi:spore coat-associated protein N